MGEMAEYMLNGDDCAGCGMPFHDAGDGFPRYCSRACQPVGFRSTKPQPGIPPAGSIRRIPCPACERLFHTDFGLAQHRESKGH